MDRLSPAGSLGPVQRRYRAGAILLATLALIPAIPSPSMAQAVKMHGAVAPGVSTMAVAGHLDPARMLTLDIRFAVRNRAQLDQLIAAQMNPGSPNYHRWITPDEFTRRFGPTGKNFFAVKNWLAANGFQIVGGSREEGYLRFSGDVASVERVFNTRLGDFGDGKFANLTEPEIPAQFADVIGDVLGMQTLARLETGYWAIKLKPGASKLPVSKRDAQAGPASGADFDLAPLGGSGHAFAAPDFYSFYDESPLLNAGNTGANGSDCIGIFANSNIYSEPSEATIISGYFKYFSQYTPFSTDPALTIDLSKESDPGVVGNGADFEAYIDIEAAHIMAPGAPITLYVTNPKSLSFSQNLSDALTAMTTENRCAALNFSVHICGETPSFFTKTLGDLFSKAQTNGQSVFVSSGDHGADMCGDGFPNVNELGANPLTTSVGGSEINSPGYDENGFSAGYSTESAWNDQNGDSSLAGENKVSGGGGSAIFSKPAWQQHVAGTSNDNARDLPDVASLAGSPYLFIYADTENSRGKPSPQKADYLVFGTSVASPSWAGFSRLLQTANGGKRLGSLNPTIWELGVAGQAANGFHDITSGNNDYISVVKGKAISVQGYAAGPGYDLVTGWGSIDADAFVTAYLNAPSPSATPTATPTPAAPSKLKAITPNLKFAATTVGAASKAQKLTLQNESKKGSAAITLIQFTMTSNIESAPGGTCAAGQMLAPQKDCTLLFTMTPATAGTNTGSVEILSNASDGDLSISASVTGKPPK
jgi:subtilase family serine protease